MAENLELQIDTTQAEAALKRVSDSINTFESLVAKLGGAKSFDEFSEKIKALKSVDPRLSLSIAQVTKDLQKLGESRDIDHLNAKLASFDISNVAKLDSELNKLKTTTEQVTSSSISGVGKIQTAFGQLSSADLSRVSTNFDKMSSSLNQAGSTASRAGGHFQTLHGYVFTAGQQVAQAATSWVAGSGALTALGAAAGPVGMLFGALIGQFVGGVLTAGIHALTSAIGGFVSASFEAKVSIQNFINSMQVFHGGTQAAAQDVVFLRKVANETGTSFEALKDGFKQLSATMSITSGTVDAAHAQEHLAEVTRKTRKTFEDLTISAKGVGATNQQISRSILALDESMGRGYATAKELNRQFINDLPGFVSQAKESYAAVAKEQGKIPEEWEEAVKHHQITTAILQRSLNDMAARLRPVIAEINDQIGGAMNQYANAVNVLATQFGSMWDQMVPGISAVTTAISSSSLQTFFSELGNTVGVIANLIIEAFAVIVEAVNLAGQVLNAVFAVVFSGFRNGKDDVIQLTSVFHALQAVIAGLGVVLHTITTGLHLAADGFVYAAKVAQLLWEQLTTGRDVTEDLAKAQQASAASSVDALQKWANAGYRAYDLLGQGGKAQDIAASEALKTTQALAAQEEQLIKLGSTAEDSSEALTHEAAASKLGAGASEEAIAKYIANAEAIREKKQAALDAGTAMERLAAKEKAFTDSTATAWSASATALKGYTAEVTKAKTAAEFFKDRAAENDSVLNELAKTTSVVTSKTDNAAGAVQDLGSTVTTSNDGMVIHIDTLSKATDWTKKYAESNKVLAEGIEITTSASETFRAESALDVGQMIGEQTQVETLTQKYIDLAAAKAGSAGASSAEASSSADATGSAIAEASSASADTTGSASAGASSAGASSADAAGAGRAATTVGEHPLHKNTRQIAEGAVTYHAMFKERSAQTINAINNVQRSIEIASGVNISPVGNSYTGSSVSGSSGNNSTVSTATQSLSGSARLAQVSATGGAQNSARPLSTPVQTATQASTKGRLNSKGIPDGYIGLTKDGVLPNGTGSSGGGGGGGGGSSGGGVVRGGGGGSSSVKDDKLSFIAAYGSFDAFIVARLRAALDVYLATGHPPSGYERGIQAAGTDPVTGYSETYLLRDQLNGRTIPVPTWGVQLDQHGFGPPASGHDLAMLGVGELEAYNYFNNIAKTSPLLAPKFNTTRGIFDTGSPNAEKDSAMGHNGFQAILHPNEAVIPLPDGRRVPVDLQNANRGQNGNARPVNLTINISAHDVDSFRGPSGRQAMQELVAKLEEATREIGHSSTISDPTLGRA